METTFELIKAAKAFMSGRSDGLRQIYELSIQDVYFQFQFVMCDPHNINRYLEDFYAKLSRNTYGLESPEAITAWINETVLEYSGDWIKRYRREMFNAEKGGMYKTSKAMKPYLSGIEIDGNEAIRAIENFICELPEIHRQTALAYYYCNLPMEKIKEVLEVDQFTISDRINFIEKTLTDNLAKYCKERNAAMPPVNTVRINKALSELSKLYKYPYVNELFENIKIKAAHK